MKENYDFSKSIPNPYFKKIQKPAKRRLINLPEEPDESAQKTSSIEEWNQRNIDEDFMYLR